MKLYQMDVKNAFLNGLIQEKVYVEQPPGFESETFPQHVFKLNKALYGHKQAPTACYEKLSSFLFKNGFEQGKVDTTLFCKNYESQFLLAQMHVDNIIFGATNEMFCEDFSKLMKIEFKMSMMGELKFFLGLQIKQTPQGIYIHQIKYVKNLLKKFNKSDTKEMKTHMHRTTYLGLDEELTKHCDALC